jgi:hypothetical protein
MVSAPNRVKAIKWGVTWMSREPDQSDDRSTSPDKVLEANNLRAFIERSQSLQRLALEEKYGPDVRLLAEDEDKLLTHLESDDVSLKQVALLCLLYFHTVYPERIVRVAADYVVNGDDRGIRSLCVRYLGQSRNEEITSVLRDCATRLEGREARPGDDDVLKFAVFCLDLVVNGPRAYAEIESMAEEILARLRSASERNVSAGQATGSQAGESDHDIWCG